MDSWWYFKSGPQKTGIGVLDWVRNLMGGGVIKWEARPDLLPDGMAGFQKKLGLPLVAHNRWYDVNTEYKKDFTRRTSNSWTGWGSGRRRSRLRIGSGR